MPFSINISAPPELSALRPEREARNAQPGTCNPEHPEPRNAQPGTPGTSELIKDGTKYYTYGP